MFTTLWIIAGTLIYALVNIGIILRVKHDRRQLILFLIFSALVYFPFIGLPLMNAAAQREEARREAAVNALKHRLGVVDPTTAEPKHDRYLNHDELERLIPAVSGAVPAPNPEATGAAAAAPFLCDFLYLYAYLLDHPDLGINQKWSLTADMPRVFYRPPTADSTAGAAPGTDEPEWSEVRRSWNRLRIPAGASPRLAFCPDPP